jgi:hypothetical protein
MKRGAIKTADNKSGGKNGVAAAAPTAAPPVPAATAARPKSRIHPIKRALSIIASLRLTVFLMALSLILVFAGTLAQIDAGIWSVVGNYFRSWFVWIPFQLFVKFGQIFFRLPEEWHLPGSVPYPAGYTIGFALLFNLLAAHAVRFKLSWKRAGIIMLHSGLVVMMIGEFITGQFAVEGNMPIENQLSSNYLESRQNYQIVIVDTTDPKENVEVAIPISLVKKGGIIKNDALPFDVVVDRYYPNANLVTEKGKLQAVEAPVKGGASTSGGEDMPAAYLTLKKKGTDEAIGTLGGSPKSGASSPPRTDRRTS